MLSFNGEWTWMTTILTSEGCRYVSYAPLFPRFKLLPVALQSINERLLLFVFPRPSLLRRFHVSLETALLFLPLPLEQISSVFP